MLFLLKLWKIHRESQRLVGVRTNGDSCRKRSCRPLEFCVSLGKFLLFENMTTNMVLIV